MTSSSQIVDALSKLDPAKDEHWTANGAPNMKAVETLVGDKSITRKHVTDAAPLFTRETALAGMAPDAKEAPVADKEEVIVASADDKEDVIDGPAPLPEVAPAEAPAGPVLAAADPEEIPDAPAVPSDTVDADERAELQKELRKLEAELGEAIKTENDATLVRKDLEARRDKIVDKLEVPFKQSFAEVMDGYKRSQQYMREDRGDSRVVLKALKDAGVLKGAQAPIDAAMARASDRGRKRPTYTPVKS